MGFAVQRIDAAAETAPPSMAVFPGFVAKPDHCGVPGAEVLLEGSVRAPRRRPIAEIQQAAAKAQWQLMGTMREQGYRMHGIAGSGAFDEAAARKSFDAMTETRKAMFESQIDARKKIDAVLTPAQREQPLIPARRRRGASARDRRSA